MLKEKPAVEWKFKVQIGFKIVGAMSIDGFGLQRRVIYTTCQQVFDCSASQM